MLTAHHPLGHHGGVGTQATLSPFSRGRSQLNMDTTDPVRKHCLPINSEAERFPGYLCESDGAPIFTLPYGREKGCNGKEGVSMYRVRIYTRWTGEKESALTRAREKDKYNESGANGRTMEER